MNDIVFYALLATLGTWLVTALGAATVVLFKSPNPKILNLMLGFAAGVMVARPAMAPEAAPRVVGLPNLIHSMTVHIAMPAMPPRWDSGSAGLTMTARSSRKALARMRRTAALPLLSRWSYRKNAAERDLLDFEQRSSILWEALLPSPAFGEIRKEHP